MAAGAVLTTTIDPTRKGAILTFVTPARNGCGMSCPYCFIDRRHEASVGPLRPKDYARFVFDAAETYPVAAVTIQGREPLEPDALRWTEAILDAAARVGAETGLVTNGWWLEQAVPQLVRWRCSGVTISIDADTPETHDRLRGAPGAWRRAMAGLRRLAAQRATDRIVVNSLVTHGAKAKLADLPVHLAEAGIALWSLSPMLRFDAAGRASAAISQQQWLDELEFLSERAAAAGVAVIADDEFDIIGERVVPGATLRTLARPDGIVRLGPDGRCSFGRDILDENSGSPIFWRPNTAVADVLQGFMH